MDKKFIKLILLAGDAILMYLSLFLVLAVRYNDYSLFPGPQTKQFVFHFAVIFFVWLVLLFSFDFYDIFSSRKRLVFFKSLALFVILAFGLGTMYFYLNSSSLIEPKTILLEDVLLFSLLMVLWRMALNIFLTQEKFKTKIAVVGWSAEMEELSHRYLTPANYEIAAILNTKTLGGFEKLKIFSDQRHFIKSVKEGKISLIIFASNDKTRGAVLEEVFLHMAPQIRIIGSEYFYEEITGKIPLSLINDAWLMGNISKSGKNNYQAAKRVFDVILSLAGLAVTAVLSPFIFLAVKADSPGSVFYTQERKGRGGKIFLLYKFRTMKTIDDQHRIWRANAADQVTRVGKILKKVHIDEFPQFYNIFRGDLSFVGPRPEWINLATEYERDIPFYKYRYLARPGFTGWAQIKYKASSSLKEAEEKFEYDLYYIKNQSFLFDVSIILKTIQLFFR
jgi:exopolysaccharide biosynthesis polyprenyl glycosylphosphotransferase